MKKTFLPLCFLWTVSWTVAQDAGFTNPKLNLFLQQCETVDKDRPECLTNGLKIFERVFNGQSPEVCDTGYLLFEDFAAECIDKINFNLPLSMRATGSFGDEYRKILERNYFTVSGSLEENTLRVETDLFAVQARLLKYLSPASVVFLERVKEENTEQNFTDLLTPEQLSQRAVYWENYLEQYPQSVFAYEAGGRRDDYLETLVFGTDTYPLFDAEGNLNNVYRDIFVQLSAVYLKGNNAKTYRTLYNFYQLLYKHDFKTSPDIWLFTF